MITTADLTHINSHAYVPEHLPAYVTAVSDAEPYLFQPFLCYMKHDTLIFIGYPLGEPFEENGMKKALDRATKKLKPVHIALTAPSASMFKNKAAVRRRPMLTTGSTWPALHCPKRSET